MFYFRVVVGRRSHRYAPLLRLEIKNLSCKIVSRINLSAHNNNANIRQYEYTAERKGDI